MDYIYSEVFYDIVLMYDIVISNYLGHYCELTFSICLKLSMPTYFQRVIKLFKSRSFLWISATVSKYKVILNSVKAFIAFFH